jgi:predicted site-specific integrase-resolvase
LGAPVVYTDVGSGLNARRGGLKRLCKAIEHGQVQRVFVTFKDRLTRFGFEYLQRYFSSHGVSIGVIRQPITRTMDEELVADMIAIITSFSGRVHGRRGHRKREKTGSDVISGIISDVVKREARKAVDAVTRRVARA